jgi:hypothetical protein
MVRALKVLAAGVLAIAIMLVAVYGISRFSGPSAAERQALRALQPSTAPSGRNGFAQLWLLPYPVPSDEQQAVLAADLARAPSGSDAFASTAQARWPRQKPVEMPGLRRCSWKDRDCLARVRGDEAGYAVLVAGNAALSARVQALGEADYVRNVFAPDPSMPMPAYQLLSVPQTERALAFVRGHHQEALLGVCSDARIARMMWKQPDSLIGGLVALAMLRGSAGLLADMLAELPADAAMPDDCMEAFAPLADSAPVCAMMQGEFAFMQAGITEDAWQSVEGVGPRRGHWLFDPNKTVARSAPRLSWPCQHDGQAQLASDKPVATPMSVAMRPWDFSCIANAVGCTLSSVQRPSMDAYSRRAQDGMAGLRVMAVLLWLRAHPDAGLDDLPADLKRGRALALDRGRGTLSMVLFEPREGQDRWEIPLPGSRLGKGR